MRQSRIINIEGRGEITVKEVSPRAVLNALQSGDVVGGFRALFAESVECRGDLLELYPSELDQIVAAFLEVNAAFFAIAERLRVNGVVGDILGGLMEQMRKRLPELYAASLNGAMSMPGTTAGPSS